MTVLYLDHWPNGVDVQSPVVGQRPPWCQPETIHGGRTREARGCSGVGAKCSSRGPIRRGTYRLAGSGGHCWGKPGSSQFGHSLTSTYTGAPPEWTNRGRLLQGVQKRGCGCSEDRASQVDGSNGQRASRDSEEVRHERLGRRSVFPPHRLIADPTRPSVRPLTLTPTLTICPLVLLQWQTHCRSACPGIRFGSGMASSRHLRRRVRGRPTRTQSWLPRWAMRTHSRCPGRMLRSAFRGETPSSVGIGACAVNALFRFPFPVSRFPIFIFFGERTI